MKPTGTPAYRLTASSIWNSFLSSGKRHLIVTGGRGSGKSTRIDQLCANMPGIVTFAVPENGVYMQARPEGNKVQIGIYDPALPGPENRMRVLRDAFDEHVVPVVRRLAETAGEWAFIDEIGYLESGTETYMNAVRALFACKRVIAAVRMQDTPFLLELRGRTDVFCVNLDDPFGNMGCVIMASGQSSRFGSNKLLADFRGEPVIHRILTSTQGIFSRRVVVTRYAEIADICSKREIDVVLHALPYRSDTVRLGVQAVGDVTGCMFCAADQPLLSKETVASLVLAAVDDQAAIWRPRFCEACGSPVVFPQWTFEELVALPQGKGGGYIAQRHPVRTVPVQSEYELMDADDRETLAMLANAAFDP